MEDVSFSTLISTGLRLVTVRIAKMLAGSPLSAQHLANIDTTVLQYDLSGPQND